MKMLALILSLALGIVPGGPAFLKPLAERDTVRVADRFEYGFELHNVPDGTSLGLPVVDSVFNDVVMLTRNWRLDTLESGKKGRTIRASIEITPFEEGDIYLPELSALRSFDGNCDTVCFEAQTLSVVPFQIDTATYKIKDIKGQIKYPLTFKEVLPWIGGVLLTGLLAFLLVLLIRRLSRRRGARSDDKPSDPAYIVALRELEKFRDDKYAAPERQKAFYSGVTDALKFYCAERYLFDAPEMTTAELFAELKKQKDIPSVLLSKLEEMFVEADFVKFAKHFSDEKTIAAAVPLAVDFVMRTYRTEQEAPSA